MQTPPPDPLQRPAIGPTQNSLRAALLLSARFWEPRRWLYNLVLTVVVLNWLAGTWPHFRAALVPSSLLPLAFLALLANLAYTAAYLVDLPLQLSTLPACLNRRRWLVWLLGTLLAIFLESYWIADEIYPDFH